MTAPQSFNLESQERSNIVKAKSQVRDSLMETEPRLSLSLRMVARKSESLVPLERRVASPEFQWLSKLLNVCCVPLGSSYARLQGLPLRKLPHPERLPSLVRERGLRTNRMVDGRLLHTNDHMVLNRVKKKLEYSKHKSWENNPSLMERHMLWRRIGCTLTGSYPSEC